MATQKTDRFLGKVFDFKGGTIRVQENLGVCYEDSSSVWYAALVTRASEALGERGAVVELPYQQLRGMLLRETGDAKAAPKARKPVAARPDAPTPAVPAPMSDDVTPEVLAAAIANLEQAILTHAATRADAVARQFLGTVSPTTGKVSRMTDAEVRTHIQHMVGRMPDGGKATFNGVAIGVTNDLEHAINRAAKIARGLRDAGIPISDKAGIAAAAKAAKYADEAPAKARAAKKTRAKKAKRRSGAQASAGR